MGNIAWIELVFFYGIAMGFGIWQWSKMRRELRQSREERAARESTEAKEVEQAEQAEPTAAKDEAN